VVVAAAISAPAAPKPAALPQPETPAAPKNEAPPTAAEPPPAIAVSAEDLAFNDLKLQGIFYSAEHPSAIINGKLMHVSQQVADCMVLEIGPSSVTVEYQNHRKTLTLR
jgi:hypothetical protein